MNVNELIKDNKARIETLMSMLESTSINSQARFLEVILREGFVSKLSTIEYSRKVKIPKLKKEVAEWLEKCKAEGISLTDNPLELSLISHYSDNAEAISIWFYDNTGAENERRVMMFYQAWVTNEYEVEEEPSWVVKNNEGKYFCTMGFSINKNKISNVIWQREKKFVFKTKEAAEAVILLVGGTVEKEVAKK